MRRWNGWGDDTIEAHLPDGALDFLRERIGAAQRSVDATKEQALACIGPSRLPAHPLIDTSAEARLTASFGQSLGDWLRLRFGRIDVVVDGVAAPKDEADVRVLLDWAQQAGLPAVTLSTFRDVPWNAPFYRKLGFVELPETEYGAGLQEIRQAEASLGLPMQDRVLMVFRFDQAG